MHNLQQWRNIVSCKKRFDCHDEHVTDENYCHPAAVLGALSHSRRDKSTDTVSKNAAIAVDVGDVTLVSVSHLFICVTYSIIIFLFLPTSHLSLLVLVGIAVFESSGRLAYAVFRKAWNHGLCP